MDFECNKEKIGRVYLEVDTSIIFGEIFVNMCIAEYQIGHKGSKNFTVIEDDSGSKVILAGNSEFKAIRIFENAIEHIKKSNFSRKTASTGSLYAVGNNTDLSQISRFYISLDVTTKDEIVFGKILEGMDVLEASSRKEKLEDVCISNCGIVFVSQDT